MVVALSLYCYAIIASFFFARCFYVSFVCNSYTDLAVAYAISLLSLFVSCRSYQILIRLFIINKSISKQIS
uniref:Uncharacterized protein n=1 Tax=Rhipicephalus microplus TaxID=6941 RepID=A0A6M2DB61_RHIMP